MSNTDTDTDLETRVEQLMTIVQAQQQQLDALREAGVDDEELVSRRSLLQGGASVGAAGLLAALASGSAAAASPGSDGDTVWGSQNNRDDWYADFIDANTVQIDNLAVTDIDHHNPFGPKLDIQPIPSSDDWQSQPDIAIGDDAWVICWAEGDGHNRNGNVIKSARTYDGGGTLVDEQTVFSSASITGRDPRMQRMDNGRIGIWYVREDTSTGNLQGIGYAESDDNGQSWTITNFDSLSGTFPSFTINDYPSSVGGDDNGGYILFLDDYIDGNGDIYAFETIDNGDNWSEQKVISNPSGYDNAGHEVSVARKGDEDRWLMITRAKGSDTVPKVYKSTDLKSWSGPFEADGQEVGSNPSSLLHWQGHYTWLAASRPYQYHSDDRDAIKVDGQVLSGVVSRTVDADDVWANPSSWGDFSVLSYVPNLHYDAGFDERDGRIVGVMGINEDIDVSTFEGPAQVGVFASSTEIGGTAIDGQQETFIKVNPDSRQSLSPGSWEAVEFDDITEDERGEWDATNYQFVPDRTGWYDIDCYARFHSGTNTDERNLRLQDVDNSTTVARTSANELGSPSTVSLSDKVRLDAATTYEMQARNNNNNDEIFENYQTVLNIEKIERWE